MDLGLAFNQFDVWIAQLEPTIGAEIRKARPVVVVSPDELNRQLRTVIVVPLTSGKKFSFRTTTTVQGKKGVAAIDQIRTLDKSRLIKRLSKLRQPNCIRLIQAIQTMFE